MKKKSLDMLFTMHVTQWMNAYVFDTVLLLKVLLKYFDSMMCFFNLLYCEMYHIKEGYKNIYADFKNKANTVLTNTDERIKSCQFLRVPCEPSRAHAVPPLSKLLLSWTLAHHILFLLHHFSSYKCII